MFIIPLEKSIDWKRPPLVTILLILSCSAILFGIRGYENVKYENEFNFYFASNLPDIELPRYAATLNAKDEAFDAEALRELLETDYRQLDAVRQYRLQRLLLRMEDDQGFMARLHGGKIVTADNAEYDNWKSLRNRFDVLVFQPVNKNYGFTPAKHRPVTFMTYMFLHDGIGHLLGNMIFLFLVGFTVEMALGSAVYLLCYLLTGLAAVGLFWAFYPSGEVPLVGASGAISGIMGLYAGIFGLRKIRFFYSLLFYFDYVKAPALIMLPVWLANEFYQMLTSPYSNVAFMAHIGGLMSGGLLAAWLKLFLSGKIDTDYLDAAKHHEDKMQRYQQALHFLGELNIPKAKKIFQELRAEYPSDREILWQLYKTLKHDPASADFYRILAEILGLSDNDAPTLKQLNDAFRFYIKTPPGKIELSHARLYSLAIRFAKNGHPENAEYITLALLRDAPGFPDLDKALYAVAAAWQQQQNRAKCTQTVALLQNHFPDSREVRQARFFADANKGLL
jgi:membrane associated rhomboid family serine protease